MGSELPDLSAVEKSIREVEVSNEPSRLLALMDISGSMQAGVPGAGGESRMTLAKQAASRGLSLYPPDSEIGTSSTARPSPMHRWTLSQSRRNRPGRDTDKLDEFQRGTGFMRMYTALPRRAKVEMQ